MADRLEDLAILSSVERRVLAAIPQLGVDVGAAEYAAHLGITEAEAEAAIRTVVALSARRLT